MQVLIASLHLRRGGEWAVHQAGDAFFHMQQIQLGPVLPGDCGGVRDGIPIAASVIERNQDLAVNGARQVLGDSLGKLDGRTAEMANPAGQHRLKGHPEEEKSARR